MAKRYRVTLTEDERIQLHKITTDGKTKSKRFVHARALLLCDSSADGPCWKVADVATALGVTSRTIEHVKRRFVENGLEAAINRKHRDTPPREVIYDGAFDARLAQLACSDAPAGHARWTVRLLADKGVELAIAPTCSPMAVCRSLKKTDFTLTAVHTGRSHRITMPAL